MGRGWAARGLEAAVGWAMGMEGMAEWEMAAVMAGEVSGLGCSADNECERWVVREGRGGGVNVGAAK